MARQSTTPVQFRRSIRTDQGAIMSSARAGRVVPVAYMPLLRGDSASGRVGIDIELAEMPKPILNAVQVHFQAWVVGKQALPRFSGETELMHSYTGEPIKQLGSSDRTPPPWFHVIDGSEDIADVDASPFFRTLGVHIGDKPVNTDLLDSFTTVYNFRLAAHSSKLPLRDYAQVDLEEALELPPAFWPTSRLTRYVPDYERALVVGALDLDIAAGTIPLTGFVPVSGITQGSNITSPGGNVANFQGTTAQISLNEAGGGSGSVRFKRLPGNPSGVALDIVGDFDSDRDDNTAVADMAGVVITSTLADIDKARDLQAFARLRSTMAGSDTTGYNNDDAIVATMMQGLRVPEADRRRPFLLDSAIVGVNYIERLATDGASLDKSMTTGRASAVLSLNVPVMEDGGYIIVTAEMLPERVDERQSDEALYLTDVDQLPNALRDVLRPEPVDLVYNRRRDARHSEPDGLYGYEPMNDVWNRQFTRLGGSYYQEDPEADWSEARSQLWLAGVVDPAFTADHWLAPVDFPHDVFADTEADAFDFTARWSLSISGLTQIGDVLVEDNGDVSAIQEVQE